MTNIAMPERLDDFEVPESGRILLENESGKRIGYIDVDEKIIFQGVDRSKDLEIENKPAWVWEENLIFLAQLCVVERVEIWEREDQILYYCTLKHFMKKAVRVGGEYRIYLSDCERLGGSEFHDLEEAGQLTLF